MQKHRGYGRMTIDNAIKQQYEVEKRSREHYENLTDEERERYRRIAKRSYAEAQRSKEKMKAAAIKEIEIQREKEIRASLWQDVEQHLNTIGGVVAAVQTVAFCIGIYALVGVMARRRNRDVALWVILSFVLLPIIIIIILLCVGKATKHEKEY